MAGARTRIEEAAAELLGRIAPTTAPVQQRLEEALNAEAATVHLLQERLADLELSLEDQGWRRLAVDGEREFTRDGLTAIIQLSRLMFLKNPLIQRAVEVRSYYVWGQGVQITARDPDVQEVLDDFLGDKGNRRVLFRHQARTETERDLEVDGNLFFALFTNPLNARVQVRTIFVDEIVDIHCNPEDRSEPWFYERRWTEVTVDPATGATQSAARVALYPDVDYRPDDRPESYGAKQVRWDSPIYHVKVGGLGGMRFGVPETYAALDWARAYKNFLEDWASLVRSLSRFAWKMSTPKGKSGAARTRLGTTVSGSRSETNPPGTTGGVAITEEGVDMTPIPKTGATTSAADSRELRLMVASAMHLPDSILSNDPQQGALATAKTLDRPTELAISDRQELWADVIRDLCGFVLVQAGKAPGSKLTGATITTGLDGSERVDLGGDRDATIDVSFPEILESDIAERINAIISAATLDGKTPAGTMTKETMIRLLLVALGVDDIDELIQSALDDDEEGDEVPDDLAEAVAQLTEAVRTLKR